MFLVELKYFGFGTDCFLFDNMLESSVESHLLKQFLVNKDHSEAKNIASILEKEHKKSQEERIIWIFSFDSEDKIENENYHFYKNNDSLEIKKKT